MNTEINDHIDGERVVPADRIGFAKLITMAFNGVDLMPLQQSLIAQVVDGTADAGVGLDLSLIAQLHGQKQTGLQMQAEVLGFHRLFRSPCAVPQPKLRVLALAAAIDMGGNTPIEFLLEGSEIELTTLYVVPGTDLPSPLPEHDVAIVIASDSDECRETLAEIERLAPKWPRPLLNAPRLVRNLDRDKLSRLLRGVEGVDIPATINVTRAQLAQAAHPVDLLGKDLLVKSERAPVIVRPRGSHAGVGLAKIETAAAMADYLAERPEQDFFLSRFVDYSSGDGQFRKYRIVVVDGKPYACHMAISEQWSIWYLNAGMAFSATKRLEEAVFMGTFDEGFAVRHQRALAGLIGRVGLDYFTIDCAETKSGDLLIFEVDNTAVVHNMDSPELFPYKAPQMERVFNAFVRMLYRHGRDEQMCAA